MKIISWNILANEFITQSDYPMIKSKILFNRNERLKNIMKMLLKVNSDVMLLQEVMEKEFKALMRLFALKYTIVRGKNINHLQVVMLLYYEKHSSKYYKCMI